MLSYAVKLSLFYNFWILSCLQRYFSKIIKTDAIIYHLQMRERMLREILNKVLNDTKPTNGRARIQI